MRVRRRIFSNLALLALGLIVAAPVAAQTVSVTGTILDSSTGQPLDAVQVNLETVGATEATLGGLTQQTGRHLIINVPVGQYVLRAQLLGFGTQTQMVDLVAGSWASLPTWRSSGSAVTSTRGRGSYPSWRTGFSPGWAPF